MPKKKSASVAPGVDDGIKLPEDSMPVEEKSTPIEPVAGLTQELLLSLMAELGDGVVRNLAEVDGDLLERLCEHHPVAEGMVKAKMMMEYIQKRKPLCWSRLSGEQQRIVWEGLRGSIFEHFAAVIAENAAQMPESESKFLFPFYEYLFARYTVEGFARRVASQKSTWLIKEWTRYLRFAGVIRIRKEKPAGKGQKSEKKPRGGQIRKEYVYAYKLSLVRKPRGGGPKYLSRIHIIRDVNAAKYKEMNFKSDKGKKVLRRFNAGIRRARAFYGGLYPPKDDYT